MSQQAIDLGTTYTLVSDGKVYRIIYKVRGEKYWLKESCTTLSRSVLALPISLEPDPQGAWSTRFVWIAKRKIAKLRKAEQKRIQIKQTIWESVREEGQ